MVAAKGDKKADLMDAMKVATRAVEKVEKLGLKLEVMKVDKKVV